MNDLIAGARVEGDIRYRGVPCTARRLADRRQAPHRHGLPEGQPFPKSVYDNVAYGPRINGIRNKGKLDEIVERSLKQRASGRSQEPAEQVRPRLSGGQAQRLCHRRTLAVEPDVVLMTSPLGPSTRSRRPHRD